MAPEKALHLDQQPENIQKSPVSSEDISKTAKNIDKSHKIWEIAKKVAIQETQEADKAIDEQLWNKKTTAKWENKEKIISGESIDFKSKLVSIDKQINSIQTQIKLIIQKGELSKHLSEIRTLKKEENKLIEEKNSIEMAIKLNEEKDIDKTVAIKLHKSKKLNKTIVKEQNEGKILDEKHSMESKKIIKQADKIKSFINILPNTNPNKQNILTKIDDIKNATNNNDIQKFKNELIRLIQKSIKSITDDLGWADENNTKYSEFKKTILEFDKSLEPYFKDLENIESWESVSTDEVIEWIEKDSGWVIDIDLKERPPVSRLRLIGSEYGFDEEIDKIALAKITDGSKDELNEIKTNWFDALKDFRNNFSKEWFSLDKMNDLYDYFDVEQEYEISADDIDDYRNAETKEEKIKIYKEKIESKLIKLQEIVSEKQAWVLKQYKGEIKELLQRKAEKKERQLDTLKFLRSIGFDILLQSSTTNKIIDYINITPWKFGLAHKIDLENWDLGFDKDFWDEAINSAEKKEFIKLFNHMLWENVVNEEIANWTTTLSIEAINRLQKLKNRTVGFFVGNLKKEKIKLPHTKL